MNLVGWMHQMREHGVPLHSTHVIVKAVLRFDPAFRQLAINVPYNAVHRLCVKNRVMIRRVAHASQAVVV